MTCYYYLDVLFKIEDTDKEFNREKEGVDIYKIKQIITKSIRNLFGEVGVGNQVDILTYHEKEGRVILRCFTDFYVKLRASLSFCCQFDDTPCSFHVVKASACLSTFLANSDTYNF